MKRNDLIDIAKGIGIILVMFAHIFTNDVSHKIIYQFHMPLFFFISGISMFYILKKDESFKVFF